MTDSSNITQDSQKAQENYRRLISAAIDAGFGVNNRTPMNLTDQSMRFNFMPIDLESPHPECQQRLFSVIYQPQDNLFYFAGSRDLSLAFGEKYPLKEGKSDLVDTFKALKSLLYPSLA